MDVKGLRKLEDNLWKAADDLRANSKLTSNQYCMPVLGLIFLRYAFGRYKMVEQELLKNRPTFHGKPLPVEKDEFKSKSALYIPPEARYDFLVNLPDNVSSCGILNDRGETITSLGEMLDHAMELIEKESSQLEGILPKDYHAFNNDSLLHELLRLFNNDVLDDVGGDIIGRIYEYFLNKFARNVAQDDGVFFTPKSLVKMIVYVLEPKKGILLDPACGSGGMFVQTGDFINREGMAANDVMTFKGQEKVEYNGHLCLMNMAVHGLSGQILYGEDANTFYSDAHHLEGGCDYVMANPPFNVDKVKSDKCIQAGRLPFGAPAINKAKEFSNANYLWISYFYAYLKPGRGRAGFVMASAATDSHLDVEIRKKLVSTGHVDVLISVNNNFFYTKSLPCTLWFFDKGKKEELLDKVLFIDARKYYTVVDRTLNEWTPWQLANLKAIVSLYRGEKDKYEKLLALYLKGAGKAVEAWKKDCEALSAFLYPEGREAIAKAVTEVEKAVGQAHSITDCYGLIAKEKTENLLSAAAGQVMDAIGSLRGKAQREKLDALTGGRKVRWTAYKKDMQKALEEAKESFSELEVLLDEARWLTDKFGDGEYRNIPGLCYVASRKEIENKKWSLTPGAYVGVAPEKDDGVDFHDRMKEIHQELLSLQKESDGLMDAISKNLEDLGL